jgi:hypothetical protein
MADSSQLEILEIACEGGLMLDRTPHSMPFGGALILQNFEPSLKGGYRRINGFAEFSATAVTGTGPILGIYFHGSSAIACRGPNVMYGTGGSWTSITSARTSAGYYHFDDYNWNGTSTLVMVDGVNYAATWDGSTYTLLNGAIGAGSGTAPTAPLDVEEHKGYLFLAQSNTITWSAPYSANDYTPGNGAGSIVIPDTIVGFKAFRGELYVFGKTSIYKLSGSSIADFTFTPITKKVGCLSKNTIREVGGDIVFLSQDGLRTIKATERIDDIELGTISEHVNDRINNLDTGTYIFSSMVIHNKNQYRLWYVTTSGAVSGTRGIIAALKPSIVSVSKDAAPSSPQPNWVYSEIVGIKPSCAESGYVGTVEYFLHGDYTDGKIYKQEYGNSFNGSAVQYIFKSPDLSLGDLGIRKRTKRAIISLLYEGAVNPSLNLIYDFGSVSVNQPTTYTLSFPSTVYLYGTAIYGTAYYSVNTEALNRIWAQGSGFTVAIMLSGADTDFPFTIRGFQLETTLGGRK